MLREAGKPRKGICTSINEKRTYPSYGCYDSILEVPFKMFCRALFKWSYLLVNFFEMSICTSDLYDQVFGQLKCQTSFCRTQSSFNLYQR